MSLKEEKKTTNHFVRFIRVIKSSAKRAYNAFKRVIGIRVKPKPDDDNEFAKYYSNVVRHEYKVLNFDTQTIYTQDVRTGFIQTHEPLDSSPKFENIGMVVYVHVISGPVRAIYEIVRNAHQNFNDGSGGFFDTEEIKIIKRKLNEARNSHQTNVTIPFYYPINLRKEIAKYSNSNTNPIYVKQTGLIFALDIEDLRDADQSFGSINQLDRINKEIAENFRLNVTEGCLIVRDQPELGSQMPVYYLAGRNDISTIKPITCSSLESGFYFFSRNEVNIDSSNEDQFNYQYWPKLEDVPENYGLFASLQDAEIFLGKSRKRINQDAILEKERRIAEENLERDMLLNELKFEQEVKAYEMENTKLNNEIIRNEDKHHFERETYRRKETSDTFKYVVGVGPIIYRLLVAFVKWLFKAPNNV